MHEIIGGLNSAIVYGDYPDSNELKAIYNLLSCPACKDWKIRIMPDHHAGAGCVIGFTAEMPREGIKVIPNIVGVDIGCGVESLVIPKGLVQFDFADFDEKNRETIPTGFNIRKRIFRGLEDKFSKWSGRTTWDVFQTTVNGLDKKIGMDRGRTWNSLGTLGGGNHYCEVGYGEVSNCYYLTVHSGSRNFGLKTAIYHQKKAKQQNPFGDLSWLEGDAAQEYLFDMHTAQIYADINRKIILEQLALNLGISYKEVKQLKTIRSVHNYIELRDNVAMTRKGAISAKHGEWLLVPWNMRDGMLIGVGKGDCEWNSSAPHGAGRLMSRKKAKANLDVADYKHQMEQAGVWSSCVGKGTLDEAPEAYKNPEAIEKFIEPTVDIFETAKPVYNLKAD